MTAESNRTPVMTGVIWNFGSLAFLALAGIGLNLIIGRAYGSQALGTFNLAFSIFIFLSQIACFGLHLSVLQAVSAESGGAEQRARVIYGGLAACAAVAAAVTLGALAAAPLIRRAFPAAPDLPEAWLNAAPGLFFFALNKYLLGAVNGLQHMRAFAVLSAARFALILLFLFALMLLKAPGAALTLALTAGEAALFLILMAYTLKQVPGAAAAWRARRETRSHIIFGAKVFPAGLVAELNTRVDVLMLGFLMSDRAAGVYTAAGLIYEAALQAVVVLRTNINPGLARDLAAGKTSEIFRLSRRIGFFFTPVLAAGAVLSVLLFPWAVELVFPGKDFGGAAGPLFWLMIAVTASGAMLCFSLILSQGGRPGWQSILMTAALAVNIAANALLIPLYGISGAGMAAGLTGIFTGVLTIILARRALNTRLFF